ncbi:DUF3857 domain-containing protein [Zhouia sp. PK063]|uniref:DUF3857 domain-containing protein n=1 Tax=Zhouia sp. PK063 TaxID=3373602 RepID=UPI0037A005D8
MKKFLLLFISVFSCLHTIKAQDVDDKNFDFKPVSQEDLKSTVYEKDSTANAVVLKEYGFARIANIDAKVGLFYEYKTRIKIFNSKAFNLATVIVPLYVGKTSREKLLKVEATVYNADGTTSKISTDDAFVEHKNEHYDLAKFTLPNIKEGSVIEYYYKTFSTFLFNFHTWEFQSEIPKKLSTYHTSIPANYIYNIKLVGNLKFSNRESKLKKDYFYIEGLGTADCVDEHYEMRDIPALIPEDYMTSEDNYLAAIRYELKTYESFTKGKDNISKTWDDVDSELKHGVDIGVQARKERYFGKLIPEALQTGDTNIEKVKKIYYYLQDYLTWNGSYKIQDIDVKDAFEKRTGSVAELNLILLNFLKAQGFDAGLMLLTTRENAYPTKLYPVISEFNYAVVHLKLDHQIYLLDINHKYKSFGRLPYEALNGYGRVFDFENPSYWEDIAISNESLNNISSQIIVDDNGTLTNNIRITEKGYLADQERLYLSNKTEDEAIESIENNFSKTSEPEISNYKVLNQDDLEKPITTEFTVSVKNQISANKKLFFLYPFINKDFKTNPFKLKKRTYDVNFGYGFSYKYRTIIKISNKFKIESIPEDFGIALPDNKGYMLFKTNKNPNMLVAELRLVMASPTFSPDEYDGLKKIFNNFIKAKETPIVLKPVQKTPTIDNTTKGK